MTYQIYRLCRDQKTIERIKEEERKYSIQPSILKTGGDLYTFINEIIDNCKTNYALICHDDVILPQTISQNIEECIKSIDEYVGEENWGVIGNAGVEYLSKNVHTILSDPHTKYLPPKYKNPIIVESIDGNTMLLNIKNLRNRKVKLPKEIKGFHLYDLILCMQSYKGGLVCLVSPWLYVIHTSGGNYQTFKKATIDKLLQNYFSTNFTNHIITSINDNIQVAPKYKHHFLPNSVINKSFEEVVESTVGNLFLSKKYSLNIIIRLHNKTNSIFRTLDSILALSANTTSNIKISIILSINNITEKEIAPFIKEIKEQYDCLNIFDIYSKEEGDRYPRVEAIANAVKFCFVKSNTSYSWIIDSDDFVFPNIGKYLPYLLHQTDIIIGHSIIFNEKWENHSKFPGTSTQGDTYDSDYADRIVTGKNFLPVCSVIYKTSILKEVFENFQFKGDYYEDYAIALATIPHFDTMKTKISFAGISYHGENTVLETDRSHWDYSYATFLSEIVNKGVIDKNIYYFLQHNVADSEEFEGFKKGKIWKTLLKYRQIKKIIKRKFVK